MSDNSERVPFGTVNDTDEKLRSKQGGQFGLNTGQFTKLEFNPNAGAEGAAADAVDIEIRIGDRDYRNRLFDVTKVYDKDGNEISDTESKEYTDGWNKEITQRMAVIVHSVKATGVTQAQIDAALATPATSFADWAKIVTSLVPDNFENNLIDVFLEWQWSIKSDNDRTYLQLPKNMKGGYFLCRHVMPSAGKFNLKHPVDGGIVYVDDAGNEHPFTRTSDFMESAKGYQQIEGEENAPTNQQDGLPSNTAQQSTW